MRAAGRWGAGLIYPPSCIGCTAATGDAHGLCSSCWGQMPFIEAPYCERYGTPFTVDEGERLVSPRAIADPPVFARARAVARYDGLARDLVHRLKYEDRMDLTRAMARMMVRAGRDIVADADLIVPVPLHRARLWRRRFNQAAALSKIIATMSGRPGELLALKRVKSTRQQVGLTRAQRADNLQGAFKVASQDRPLIAGRRVLLIDDVLTTGATANAASRALLRAGAAHVDVLVFAQVVTGE